jgi:hypothetical protein
MDFDDPKMLDRVVENSNVVINLIGNINYLLIMIGPRPKVKAREDFEYINIELSKRIADACARNSEVT